jgi:soluble lytic murein transglycosylase-like protein
MICIESPNEGSPSASWRRAAVVIGFTSAMMVSAPNHGFAVTLQTSVAADTTPPAKRRLFERRVLFSPAYLGRILTAARRSEEIAEERAAEAATYAERYDISTELAATIIDSAVKEGLDPELGFRMVRVESVFRLNARGPSGSLGLTQLMPSTARAIDRSLRTEAQILDPVNNLRVGFRYLRGLIERYGNVRLGLLAYNRGEGTVDRALRSGRDPENGYSALVLELEGIRYTGDGTLDEEDGAALIP